MPSSSNRNDICCIFDFDGTLVDNFNSAIEKFNILADDFNFFLGIVTSNSKENVTSWLDSYKIKHFFHFIHVEPNYFGKNRVIKKVLKKYRMSKSHVFYIGDETRDIDAAKQNGIYSIAVTWGFNSEKILLQHQPHYIARNPNDLLTICGLDS